MINYMLLRKNKNIKFYKNSN